MSKKATKTIPKGERELPVSSSAPNESQSGTTCHKLTQKLGNKEVRSRKWCITFNNYTPDDYEKLCHYVTVLLPNAKYVIAKEVGEKGTPHLQGFFETKNAVRWTTLNKMFPNCWFKPSLGNIDQNRDYCGKQGDFITNIEKKYTPILCPILKDDELYDWQKNIVNILATEPDKRTINWVHDPSGGVGKTTICRKLFREKKIMWIKTANEDQIKTIIAANQNCRDFCFDLPRCQPLISYRLLEELKDGLLFSGRYEGCCKEIAIPHIIVFSNREPNYSGLTEDRWNIIRLEKNDDFSDEYIELSDDECGDK